MLLSSTFVNHTIPPCFCSGNSHDITRDIAETGLDRKTGALNAWSLENENDQLYAREVLVPANNVIIIA